MVLADNRLCVGNHVNKKELPGTSWKVREESGMQISLSKTAFTDPCHFRTETRG